MVARKPPAPRKADFGAGLEVALGKLEAKTGHKMTPAQKVIGEDETFLEWCNRLGGEGMKVDGKPFRLDDRPAMAWIYDQLPCTVEEAHDQMVVLMKCAQVGFTLLEMLYSIYAALKFEPCFVGMYLPDQKLAAAKSSVRFMPVIRTIPAAYERLITEGDDGGRRRGEGNIMIRILGDSRLHFLWTSGKAMTESFPMDILSFDEVQEMLIADMEKTAERLGGSRIKFQLMGSTAKWPEADIHYWYLLGQQWEFWTKCEACGESARLDEAFPNCIRIDPELDDHRYCCVHCGAWLNDTQHGEWRAQRPRAHIKSIHFHQMLSPTVSAGEIMRKFQRATDMQNFHNRTLGKPYSDPSQIPVNLQMLNDCARLGVEAGVIWKRRARDTYMGIDQMGAFNVVIIKERMPDGRQAVIHVEEIYSNDPFKRCDELMAEYGVAICCVETLPNYNDAKRFALRHVGRVFLAGYQDLKEEMLRWGDAPRPDVSERRTDQTERDRYTVMLNQYKCMQVSMARIVNKTLLFPDPDALRQEVKDKNGTRIIPLLRERVFTHFTKTALVVEKDEEQKKYTTKVVKVGIDPHFSYANMLCDVAWARAHGTATFVLPKVQEKDPRVEVAEKMNLHGLPNHVAGMMMDVPTAGEVCGRCEGFKKDTSMCSPRDILVRPGDPRCILFVPDEFASPVSTK